MKFLLGRKQGMTQVFSGDKRQAVTLVAIEPQRVVEVKTKDKAGYAAVQVGFGRMKRAKKSLLGVAKKAGVDYAFAGLQEFRTPADGYRVGRVLDAQVFAAGEEVSVTGVSKGKGFQGVVRRHGFHGHPATHGHKDQLRMPGSIGAGGVQHVFKGLRMAGQMGNVQRTVKGLEVIGVDPDANTLLIKGALPGARGSLLRIVGVGVPPEEKPVEAAPQPTPETAAPVTPEPAAPIAEPTPEAKT